MVAASPSFTTEQMASHHHAFQTSVMKCHYCYHVVFLGTPPGGLPVGVKHFNIIQYIRPL